MLRIRCRTKWIDLFFGGAFLHRVHKSSSWKKGALVLLHWWGKDLKQDVPFHVIYRLMTLRTPHV